VLDSAAVKGRRAIEKLTTMVREQGPKQAAKFIADEVKLRVYEPNRVLVMLKVDLTEPKNLVRDRDRDEKFRIQKFEPSMFERMKTLLERTEPVRIESVRTRAQQGMRGFVAEDQGQIVGYVFWVPGSDDPNKAVHPDLEWLPMQPTSKEVYTFDYWIASEHRGRGNLFARFVQQAHHDLGYEVSFGYVDAVNTAALWLYRTVGWREVGRITEHKILRKLAIVEDRLYRIHPYSRSLLGKVSKRCVPKSA